MKFTIKTNNQFSVPAPNEKFKQDLGKKRKRLTEVGTCRNIEPGEIDFLLCPKLRCRDADAGVQNDSVAFDVARDVAQTGSVAYSDDNEKLDGDDERHFNFFFC